MSKVINPNSFFNRSKKFWNNRWITQDSPQTEPRFQINLLLKDVLLFIGLPLSAIIFVKLIEKSLSSASVRKNSVRLSPKDYKFEAGKSQIVDFKKPGSGSIVIVGQKAPGTLVKVKLLNVVETFGNVPVHVQIIDDSLGKKWTGSTIIGEASSDDDIEKIKINFILVKSAYESGLAKSIKARALMLDGTYGIEAKKKEGFFARAVFGSSSAATQENLNLGNENKVNDLLIRALAGGFLKEATQSANVWQRKSQVLTLNPGEVFFVELTDYFPKDLR